MEGIGKGGKQNALSLWALTVGGSAMFGDGAVVTPPLLMQTVFELARFRIAQRHKAAGHPLHKEHRTARK